MGSDPAIFKIQIEPKKKSSLSETQKIWGSAFIMYAWMNEGIWMDV